MANILFSILSTFDDKGLKKGKKEISAFDKQIKKFGKTFAAVFSARALFNFSKKAVNAFAADEKAAKSLEIQLKNTGFAFSAPSVEYFIANLQKTTGVLDDDLRPAFQKLLSVTGSITKSQDALQIALNLSAAGYGSVVDVSQALAKGFGGQTTALGRLIPSLDKATVKSGDMNKIMRELNIEFAGQSAARLTTYAGKMDLLKVALENVKEEIGKGIIDALDALSKDTSIADTATKMENFGKTTADVITGVGVLIAELQKLPGVKKLTDLLFDISVFGSLSRLGKMDQKPAELPFNQQRSAGRISAQQFKQEKIARDRLIVSIKAEEALKKLKDKYDVERIGLMAALNFATDDETKLRIAEKLAILDGNAARAKEYLADRALLDISNLELLAKQEQITALKELTKGALQASFAMGGIQRGEYSDVYKNMSNVPAPSGGGGGGGGFIPSPTMTMASDYSSYRAGERFVVNVAGSILTDDDLTDTIQRTILQINKQGRGTTPAGGLSGGT